jgi:transcriptional regulator with XRE-family HTH domain
MRLNFEELLSRLRSWLDRQVHNGALTERGLARRAGLSQSHIHNVLKGVRILTPATADRILEALGLTVLDFLEREEAERLLPLRLEQDQAGSPGPPGETRLRMPPGRALPPGRSGALRRPSSPS